LNTSNNHRKLLFVIDNLSTGGAQRQMVNLSVGMSRRGYQVEIFCYSQGDLLAKPLIEAGIPIHWHIKRSRYSFDVILALRDLISRRNYDLALAFLTTPNFYTILAGSLLRTNRIPVVVSERFCDLPNSVSWLERFVRQFYRIATHVVTNSHHQRINLSHKYPWLKNRLSTIYNGYDLNIFSPAVSEPDNKPLQILTIASVSPYKNGLVLVEALNILKRKYNLFPRVDWIGQLVMQGERLQYLNQMKAAISKYELESQWNWLNQRLDIVDQLHQHDVLIHPSFGEGLPNVVCEAMACGRPVIVSDSLDHSHLVQDGKNGFLFDYRDAESLAQKIKIFVDMSPAERQIMGQWGRKFAEENLSLERFVNDYEKLFLNILRKQGDLCSS